MGKGARRLLLASSESMDLATSGFVAPSMWLRGGAAFGLRWPFASQTAMKSSMIRECQPPNPFTLPTTSLERLWPEAAVVIQPPKGICAQARPKDSCWLSCTPVFDSS